MQSSSNPPPINQSNSGWKDAIVNTITNYLSPPLLQNKPVLVEEVVNKKSRASTTYKQNMTAALALPDRPKFDFSACNGYAQQSIFSSLTNSVSALIYPPIRQPSKLASDSDQPSIYQTVQNLQHDIDSLYEQLSQNEKQAKKDEVPARIDQLHAKQIDACEMEIKEHAKRRVDLFFYLAVAVYNTGVLVKKAPTAEMQHGKCSESGLGTHACHASLFPHLILEKPSEGYIRKVLPAVVEKWIYVDPDLTNTHFKNSLNIGDELPAPVNGFDGHMEGRAEATRYIEYAISILNETSKTEIDPAQAMTKFYRAMLSFFDRYEKNTLIKKRKAKPEKDEDIVNEPKKNKKKTLGLHITNRKIWDYQKEGTFCGANIPDLTMKDDYLYSLLRLTPNEIRAAKWVPGAAYVILMRNYNIIQREIYESKNVPENEGKKNLI